MDRVSLGEFAVTGSAGAGCVEGVEVPLAAQKWAVEQIKAIGKDIKPVAIVDSSFGLHRTLDKDWVREVCNILRDNGYYPLVLGAKTGLTDEADTRFVKKTTFTECAALLYMCYGIVSCDTGLTALAGLLGVPQVCVYQSQFPWLRIRRLPGAFVGFCCVKRSLPSPYGGDMEHDDMPPAEEAAASLLGLMDGRAKGCYWHEGRYFDYAIAVSAEKDEWLNLDCTGLDVTFEKGADAYYQAFIAGPVENMELHEAIAALEEQQVAIATIGEVTIVRTSDLGRSAWLLRGPVRDSNEPLRSLLAETPNDPRMASMRKLALKVMDLPGAAAELGVYKGGITRMLALMLPDKRVIGFDTFAGLPALKHTIDYHTEGEYSAEFAEVSKYLSDLPNVELRQGVFPDTTNGLHDEQFCLVHLDADFYESTRLALSFFWPKMVEGGIIVLDDYGWKNTEGVTKAVDDFLAITPAARLTITTPMQAIIEVSHK